MRISKSNKFRTQLLELLHTAKRDSQQNKVEKSRRVCKLFENGFCLDADCREQFVLERLQWSRKYGNYYCKRCRIDWEQTYRKAKAFLERNS